MSRTTTFLIALAASAAAARRGAGGRPSQDALVLRRQRRRGDRGSPEALQKENSDIKVVLDNVAYDAIQTQLPVQLEAGNGPDLARVTNIKAQANHWLDLRPHLKDAAPTGKQISPTTSTGCGRMAAMRFPVS